MTHLGSLNNLLGCFSFKNVNVKESRAVDSKMPFQSNLFKTFTLNIPARQWSEPWSP